MQWLVDQIPGGKRPARTTTWVRVATMIGIVPSVLLDGSVFFKGFCGHGLVPGWPSRHSSG